MKHEVYEFIDRQLDILVLYLLDRWVQELI